MSKEDYIQLMQEFCDESGLEDVAAVLNRGVLQLDDTLIGIEYLEARDEVRLLVDLGEPQGADPSELMKMLLEANLISTGPLLPTFSLQPETGRPVVAFHIPLPALLEGEMDLVDLVLEQLAPMLDEWRAMLDRVFDSPLAPPQGGPASIVKV